MNVYVVCQYDYFGVDGKAYTSEDEAERAAEMNRNPKYPENTWVDELEVVE